MESEIAIKDSTSQLRSPKGNLVGKLQLTLCEGAASEMTLS